MLTTPVADGTVTTDILRFADLAAVKVSARAGRFPSGLGEVPGLHEDGGVAIFHCQVLPATAKSCLPLPSTATFT